MDYSNIYFSGIIIGFISLIITGIFHPIVIKLEYYYGKKSWKLLFVIGLFCVGISLFSPTHISIFTGVLAFSLFWSCIELFKQHKRVLLGRAKKNPTRNYE